MKSNLCKLWQTWRASATSFNKSLPRPQNVEGLEQALSCLPHRSQSARTSNFSRCVYRWASGYCWCHGWVGEGQPKQEIKYIRGTRSQFSWLERLQPADSALMQHIAEETTYLEKTSPFQCPYKDTETKPEGLPLLDVARLWFQRALSSDEKQVEELFLQAFSNPSKKETAVESVHRLFKIAYQVDFRVRPLMTGKIHNN